MMKEGLLELDIALPGVVTAAKGDDQVAGARRFWLPEQAHSCFVRQPVAFAMVTCVTGTRRVTPLILATARLGNDVIDGEIAFDQRFSLHRSSRLPAAVNAGEAVAHQNAAAAPVCLPAWNIDVAAQRNDGWNWELLADGAEELIGLFNDNRLFPKQEVDRARNRDDRQRLPCATVEEKDSALNGTPVGHNITSAERDFLHNRVHYT